MTERDELRARAERAEAERDEALGLLRELVGLEEECSPSHGDYPRLYESAWARARALVERAGPAGAHPAASDKFRLAEWEALPNECLFAGCENTEIDQRGPVWLRGGLMRKACTEHWVPIFRVLGEQASWEKEDASREALSGPAGAAHTEEEP